MPSNSEKPLVIVLDSSVWVRIVRSKTTISYLKVLHTRRAVHIFSSNYLLTQVRHGLRSKLGLTSQQTKKYTRLIERLTVQLDPSNVLKICRDPTDDPILALAVEANCVYLVSQDDDLLVLDNYKGVKMVTTAEFLEIIGV